MSLTFRPGPSRRRPRPFDLILNGTGLMLGRADEGQGRPSPQLLVSETADLSQVAPTDYSYGAMSPEVERTQPYEDFTLGLGLQRQEAFVDKRYHHTVNVDMSVPGLWLKGPDLVPFAPLVTDATNGVSGFFDLGGVVHAVAGRYILARANDASWTVSKDLADYGAGTVALDAVTFYSNGLAAERAWVGLSPSSENFAEFDGGTWTQAAGADMEARAWAVVGREFFRARDTNMLTKCDTDADPRVAANWAAPNAFRIGDKSSAIVRMFVNAVGVLVIVKTDGIYSLASDGSDIRYFPFLKPAASDDNGKGAGAFLNDWYIPFRSGLYRLTPDFQIRETGPEQQNQTDWLAGLRTTAFAGHDNLHAYAGVTDETDGYLLKLLPSGVWHGAISLKFVGKKITALHKSTIGAPLGRTRLYVGFSDGTLGWFTLPNTADPSADPAYRFSVDDGELHVPEFTSLVGNDPKVLYALTVNGRNLSGSDYVRVEYQLDPLAAGWTVLDNNFDTPRERFPFPDNTGAVVTRLKFVLENTATTGSPQVTGAGLHHAWRPERREVYVFNVLCQDGLVRWDNTPLRYGRERIRAAVELARDTVGSVPMILPDHSSQEVTVLRIGETQAYDDRTRQWTAALQVKAVQFGTLSVYGTHARLEALRTHAAMEALGSHARMEQL